MAGLYTDFAFGKPRLSLEIPVKAKMQGEEVWSTRVVATLIAMNILQVWCHRSQTIITSAELGLGLDVLEKH